MATRPYAYNTGTTINGTTQTGAIAIGQLSQDYSGNNPGGVTWWMGPDEDTGCVITVPVPAMNHPTPLGNISGIEFWRSPDFTDASVLATINDIARGKGQAPFSTLADAENWLILSGYPSTNIVQFQSVQPATLNQVSLSYIIDSGQNVYIDWGYGSPVTLTADGTEKTVTSSYVTNNTTYNIKISGQINKIRKFWLYNEPTITLNSSEIRKMSGLREIYMRPFGGNITMNSADLKNLSLTGLTINNSILASSIFTTQDLANMPLTQVQVGLSTCTTFTARTEDFVGRSLTEFNINATAGTAVIDSADFAGMPLGMYVSVCYGNQSIKSADFADLPITYFSIRGGPTGSGMIFDSGDFTGKSITYFDIGHLPSNTIIDTSDLIGMPLASFFLYGNGGTYDVNTADFSGFTGLTTFYVNGAVSNVNVQGQLSDLPTGLLSLSVVSTTSDMSITSGTMKAWTNTEITLTNHHSSANVDGFLNAWATPAGTGTKTITLQNARTSASDAAVTTLQGKGKTIVTAN